MISFNKIQTPQSYRKLESEEAEAFLKTEPPYERQNSSLTRAMLLWVLFLVFGLTILLLALENCLRNLHPKYFRSDFPDAQYSVEYEQRLFTGRLVWDENLKRITRAMDSEVEYFGRPSNELEAAWAELLRDRVLIMTPEEAAPFLPELMPALKGQYLFQPDMYHSLHCVNILRIVVSQILYPDAKQPFDYTAHSSEITQQTHIEHCMDRLRQVVLCHGDLTPSPFYPHNGFRSLVGRTEEHTCRKPGAIRKWMDERKELYPVTLNLTVHG